MDGLLSKEQMLAGDDLATAIVVMPEWRDANGNPGRVRVREAMACELDKFDDDLWVEVVDANGKLVSRKNNFTLAKAQLLVRCIVDEEGDRVYEDKDAEALSKRSAAAITRLYIKIRELSKVDKAAVRELEKNSEAGEVKQNDSATSSPAT